MTKTVLVVEDDKNTNQVICEVLKDANYIVIPVFDGENAITAFFTNKIDFVILDIMLPKKNGMDVLKELRQYSNVPVIMLTALGDEYTQIKSFDLQADEYVTKPFSPIVLVKRVNNLLRRSNPIENTIVSIGDIMLDFSSYSAIKNGTPIAFTTKEMQILKCLIEHEGKVLSREQILENAWGFGFEHTDRTVDTHIKNIRKKLGVDCISTIKNIGYKFEVNYETKQ